MTERASLTIWVDADAAPRDVKEIVYRAAERLELETVLVANRLLTTPRHNPFVEAICVPGGPDAADAHIAENAAPGDLAITADIPLAAILVAKDVIVLDHRGDRSARRTWGSASRCGTSWSPCAAPV